MIKVIAAGLYRNDAAPKTGDWILAWFDIIPNNTNKTVYEPFVVRWASDKWIIQARYAAISFDYDPYCWSMIYPPKELLNG